jgi:hypothetical protein
LVAWTEEQTTPAQQMDSLVGVLHHVSDAWVRRQEAEADVVLVHYADLLADLEGQMRWLAAHLGIDVAAQSWPALVRAASFDGMRSRADQLVPDRLGVLKDPARFFRAGQSGGGAAVLSPDELDRYERRVSALAAPEVVAWLHR